MALQEKTFKRDLKYSLRHRPPYLPEECKAWDIDYVEVRNGQIRAILEVAETQYPLERVDLRYKQGHKFVLKKLYELTKIPVYIVYHNPELIYFKPELIYFKPELIYFKPELIYFKRFTLVTNQIDILSEKDYWDWIKTL